MSLKASNSAQPSRVDLQESSESDSSSRAVSGAHLNEIRQRLLVEPKSLPEAYVSWALEVHSFLSGTRGIARWTQSHKETVQEMAAKEGGVSKRGFLYTARRGSSSVSEDEREDMVLRFNSLTGRSWSPLGATGYRSFAAQYLSKFSIPSGAWTWRILEEGKIQRGNGRETTGIGEGLGESLALAHEEFEKLTSWGSPWSSSWTLLTILDTANDLWAEENLGKHAWRLAILFGAQNIAVTQADLMALTGLADRPVRRLLGRWKANPLGLVMEEKVGRSKYYVLAFHSVLHPDGSMYSGHLGDKTRLYAAMGRDQKERATAARRGTPEGAIAWKAANPRTRQTFLDDLPEATAQEWRELVERGDELEIHAYLVEQAKEAGAVPSTPETCVVMTAVQVSVKRPAQEFLETAELSAKVAEMRKRVVSRVA
ncbi:hypothetical protein ACFV2E_08195 [Streptomyces globisporus]|uniref:hypothetical protein n=1 Tax=Streptomyces globisporus TaxID=1908 RepID=UPI0036988A0B